MEAAPLQAHATAHPPQPPLVHNDSGENGEAVLSPHLRYVDEFIGQLSCASMMLELKLIPNAKELTETMAAFNGERLFEAPPLNLCSGEEALEERIRPQGSDCFIGLYRRWSNAQDGRYYFLFRLGLLTTFIASNRSPSFISPLCDVDEVEVFLGAQQLFEW
jgi:hypothetical protein